MRIVVADREARVRSALQVLDAALNIQIIAEATDIRQLIDYTADRAPDVIVLDLNLPGLDPEFHLSALRFFGLGSRIIALSNNRSDRVPALSAGADYFFYKGDSAVSLVKLLESLTSQFI